MIVGELLTKLGFQYDRAGLDRAQQGLSTLQGRMGELKQSAMGLKGMIAGALATYVGFTGVRSIIDTTTQVENLTVSFETMLGTRAKADELVTKLRDLGARTPYEFTDLAENSKLLLQYGISQEKLIPTFNMLGDIAMGNKEKLGQLTYAYAQMSSTGRATGDDMRQMITAGFNPLTIIAAKTGESIDSLKARMAKGKITMAEVSDAFKTATSEGGTFYKGMDKGSKTLTGLWSTLKDNMASIRLAIGNEFLGTMKDVVGSMNEMTMGWVTKVQTWARESLPPIIQSIKDGWVQLKQIIVDSGVLESIRDAFAEIAGPQGKKTNSVLSGLFSVLGSIVKVGAKLVKWIADFIGFLGYLNNQTGGLLVKLAAWGLAMAGVYKYMYLIIGLNSGLTKILGLMMTAGTQAGAAGGIKALAGAFNPLTLAIMAAVSAYMLLNYWIEEGNKKIDENLKRNAEFSNVDKQIREAKTFEEAKKIESAAWSRTTQVKEIKDMNDRLKAKGQDLDEFTFRDQKARLDKAMDEAGIPEQQRSLYYNIPKAHRLGGDRIDITDYGMSVFASQSKLAGYALKDYGKTKAKASAPPPAPQITNNINSQVKMDVPESMTDKKKMGEYAGEKVRAAFSIELQKVLLTTI